MLFLFTADHGEASGGHVLSGTQISAPSNRPRLLRKTPLEPNRRALGALIATQICAVLALHFTTAAGQIAIDNTTSSSGDTAMLSFRHTVHSGSDPLLMVGVEVHAQTKVTSVQWGSGATNCSSACDPASCLCALTQVETVTNSGKNVTVQLWRLSNPPAGTGDIVITLPSAHRVVSGATSFLGVDQINPLGAAATNSADTTAPPTVNVSSTAGGIVLDAVGTNPNATLAATGTGQSQLYQDSAGTGGASSGWVTGAGSTAPGGAVVTMSWSGPPVNWAIIAVLINPARTPTGGPYPTPSATPPTFPSCVGDCSDSNTVSIDALLTLVKIALGEANRPPSSRGTAERIAGTGAGSRGSPAAAGSTLSCGISSVAW